MKARQLIAKSSFGPDELKIVFKAYDDAWAILAPTISRRADAIEAARLKLANIILGLARDRCDNAERIKTAALQSFRRRP
jgi:hypothetical protein